MKYLLRVAVLLLVMVALMAGAGWLLPVGHVASRSSAIAAPPEAVFAAIRAVERYPEWRSGVSRVEVLDTRDGTVRFREHGSDGPVVMEIVAARPPFAMTTRIADPDQPFGGTWTFDIAPDREGSSVTITERGEVYNPIFRLLARYVFGYTRGLERYLSDLKTHLDAPR